MRDQVDRRADGRWRGGNLISRWQWRIYGRNPHGWHQGGKLCVDVADVEVDAAVMEVDVAGVEADVAGVDVDVDAVAYILFH